AHPVDGNADAPVRRDQRQVLGDEFEIDKEKPPSGPWDLKLMPGGVIDREFISQYRALIAPTRGGGIAVNGMSTGEAMK
ncbi:hypothetical protein AB9F45_39195, partial [Rhizobium leguminosarum]|uniref:hypothetical protein n=1 Tax=Rhizobium leguminosarum TaxID=384 RepID=UPI003F9A296D